MQQGKRGFKKCQDSNDNQQKAISDELAAALNDGLVFYEQVLLQMNRSKQMQELHCVLIQSILIVNVQELHKITKTSSVGISSILEGKASANVIKSGSNFSESGSFKSTIGSVPNVSSSLSDGNGPRPRRRANKFSGSLRLFPTGSNESSLKGRYNNHNIITESPPNSVSVGFLFGATPPDNLRLVSAFSPYLIFMVGIVVFIALYGVCSNLSSSYGSSSLRLGTSPHGVLAASGSGQGCSPPVGSLPKSFPQFQHPSHALLEDNGFKQQQ